MQNPGSAIAERIMSGYGLTDSGAKRPFISASRPIRSETEEADLLLRAIKNLSDGVPA
jgi:hypothetical protein